MEAVCATFTVLYVEVDNRFYSSSKIIVHTQELSCGGSNEGQEGRAHRSFPYPGRLTLELPLVTYSIASLSKSDAKLLYHRGGEVCGEYICSDS